MGPSFWYPRFSTKYAKELWLRMSQPLDKCRGIKSLDARFHGEDRPDSEDWVCGFIPIAPIV